MEERRLAKGIMKELFGADGTLLYLDYGGGYIIVCVGQAHRVVYLKEYILLYVIITQ